jgi:hypothetical protein
MQSCGNRDFPVPLRVSDELSSVELSDLGVML